MDCAGAVVHAVQSRAYRIAAHAAQDAVVVGEMRHPTYYCCVWIRKQSVVARVVGGMSGRRVQQLRSSPAQSAASQRVGTRREGNDGSVYEVRAASNGVHRWVRVQLRPQGNGGVVVKVTLRPTVGILSADGDVAEASITRAISRGVISLGDLVGPDALRVVRNSMQLADGVRVKEVAFDMARWVYVCVAAMPFASHVEARASLQSNYGNLAADTWMEGDIRITRGRPVDCELHLALVSVVSAS